MLMHKRNILSSGLPIEQASRAMILLHGRGADARGIMDLSSYLDVKDFALLAPQATNYTWYPYSFMAPQQANQPWLDSAIATVHGLIDELMEHGLKSEQIYLLGFSQGACLTLESAARKARRYGAVIAFTGGLIGEQIDTTKYAGSFDGTPILICSGDPDPHVPVSRVKESTRILTSLGAKISEHIFPGMPHTVTQEEIELANTLINS